MKSAITVLNEMSQLMRTMPTYEYIGQTGPPDRLFLYNCTSCAEAFTGSGLTKQQAKQNAAKEALEWLSKKGQLVPRPYAHKHYSGKRPVAALSYVALLNMWCQSNNMATVEYELVEETGPPHMRNFTMRACVGLYSKYAIATSKKRARQLVAEQMYLQLRGNNYSHFVKLADNMTTASEEASGSSDDNMAPVKEEASGSSKCKIPPAMDYSSDSSDDSHDDNKWKLYPNHNQKTPKRDDLGGCSSWGPFI